MGLIDTLASELTTDPLARGYAGMTDAQAAADLNTKYRTEPVETVSGSDVLNATDDTDFTGLATADKGRWLALCGVDRINVDSGAAKSLAVGLFTGKTTLTNLQALKTRSISRAQELGLGFLYARDIAAARAL